MITQETARKIYNCYNEILRAEQLIEKMQEAIAKHGEIKIEDNWGGSRYGLSLGIPSGGSSERIVGVNAQMGIKVIKSHIKENKKELKRLRTIAEIELGLCEV